MNAAEAFRALRPGQNEIGRDGWADEAALDLMRPLAEPPPLLKKARKPKRPKDMVGDIIEARFIQPFGGDLYVKMFVVEDRGESFGAKTLREPLPGGYTYMAFEKRMRGHSWR
jgi:hypothetical protein